MRCLFLQNPKNDLDSKKQPPYFMSKVMGGYFIRLFIIELCYHSLKVIIKPMVLDQ